MSVSPPDSDTTPSPAADLAAVAQGLQQAIAMIAGLQNATGQQFNAWAQMMANSMQMVPPQAYAQFGEQLSQWAGGLEQLRPAAVELQRLGFAEPATMISAIVDDCRKAAAGYANIVQQGAAHAHNLNKMQFDANQQIVTSMQETNQASWDAFNRMQDAWRRNF